MALDRENILRDAWLSGRGGTLSGKEAARAWALREVWRDEGKPTYGMNQYIARKVQKVGGGHPQRQAVSKLLQSIDNDDDWFPGKSASSKSGPDSAINGTNQAVIAASAMAMKARGVEPTYARLVAANPKAALNPVSKKPVGKKRIYSIMKEYCYDEDPADPWTHRPRLSRTALTKTAMERRLAWAQHVKGLNHSGTWYYKRLVWTDLCNSILPRSEKRASEQALARKGKKAWGSEGTK